MRASTMKFGPCAVLGIDAAWSDRNPSAVALLAEDKSGWRCLALAPSYREFVGLSIGLGIDWLAKRKGTAIDTESLLEAANRMLDDQQVAVVAVDMPLSTTPITGRRLADNLISAEYGNKGCSTHSPVRPELEQVSMQLKDGFHRAGFRLVTACKHAVQGHSLIEVYPHPALLMLLREDYRVPYKVGKARSYWPNCSIRQRKHRLLGQFRRILNAIKREVAGVSLALPSSADALRHSQLKAYEDSLDALICAWVGITYLRRRARPFGNDTAAIWVPR